MKDLRVALVQEPINWQNPEANRQHFAALFVGLDADLIVLPEVFTTGFGGDGVSTGEQNGASIGEPAGGVSYTWMAQQAALTGAVITGSLIIVEEGKRYNRLVWMRPDGSYDEYDKRHLFRMGGEHKRYSAGRDKLLVELLGWRVCPLICYDLRFPVFSRNQVVDGDYQYDLCLYVANWPDSRRHHWRSLLLARAIENQACVVGVNRIGADAKRLNYSGDSLAFDARGEVLLDMQAREGVDICQFSAASLLEYRERFPAYLDADEFRLDS